MDLLYIILLILSFILGAILLEAPKWMIHTRKRIKLVIIVIGALLMGLSCFGLVLIFDLQ